MILTSEFNCLYTFYQTGSGKTYTMWGPANGSLEEHLSGDQRGLTPRVFELLFARISEVMFRVVYFQSVSSCERGSTFKVDFCLFSGASETR